VIAAYMHNSIVPNLGKIGVLVALESDADKSKLAALGKQVAMHVAATNPQALTIDSVDPAALERERAVLAEQAKASGKPAEIIGKMVEGRLRKYYEDVVLLEQVYVIDGESRVKQVVEKAGKELGSPVKIAGYVRIAVGEGIDKEQASAA
jgi:elongation factor Ts